jgi:hypothetical protein
MELTLGGRELTLEGRGLTLEGRELTLEGKELTLEGRAERERASRAKGAGRLGSPRVSA